MRMRIGSRWNDFLIGGAAVRCVSPSKTDRTFKKNSDAAAAQCRQQQHSAGVCVCVCVCVHKYASVGSEIWCCSAPNTALIMGHL
jgi:hypothetical protein